MSKTRLYEIKSYHIVLYVAFFLFGIIPGKPPLAKTLNPETILKISIDEDGMYRITYLALLDAGIIPESINPENLRMTNQGNLIPLYFSSKETRWNKPDYLEFYGTFNHGTKTYFDEYTDTNIYYLHWQNDRVPSNRYQEQNMNFVTSNLTTATPLVYKTKIHREEKTAHSRWEDANFDTQEHWYWYELTAPEKKAIYFTLPGLYAARHRDCSIRIKFFGVSHLPQNPDHYIVISVNNHIIGEARWDGNAEYLFTNNNIPISFFNPGKNTLTIALPGKESDPKQLVPEIDVVFLSWFEVEYWRSLSADNNYLQFQLSQNTTNNNANSFTAITHFSQDNINLYNLTETTKIEPMMVVKPDNQGQTTYSAYFNITNNEMADKYIAFTWDRYKTPLLLEKKQRSHWKTTTLGADYIIITHSAFYDSLLPLVQWRKSQGLRVQLIKVEDIYDEFNYGIMNPQAIKDFLQYAYKNWKPPQPKYVLLVGDASWDIKGNLNLAAGKTFIPVYFYSSPSGYAACDNWYAAFEGNDDTPELAIGRIPAHSGAEIQAVVNKILEYEQNQEYGPWRQSVLLLATPRDWTARVNDTIMREYLPQQFNPLPRYSTHTSRFQISPKKVIQWFNQGQFLLHYSGHASVFNWDIGRPGEEGAPEAVGYKEQGFFGIRHVPKLQNRLKYPIIISMTCYSNQFDSMRSDGIGESLLKADQAGAIAVVGGTYRVSEGCFEEFDRVFIPRLLSNSNSQPAFKLGKGSRLGDILLQTKRELNNLEVNNLYVLLGDPALSISIPKPIENIQTQRMINGQQEIVSVYGITTTERYHYGYIQILTPSGELIETQQIKLNTTKWQGSFSLSSIYRNTAIVATVYLWNEKNRLETAGRVILPPITLSDPDFIGVKFGSETSSQRKKERYFNYD